MNRSLITRLKFLNYIYYKRACFSSRVNLNIAGSSSLHHFFHRASFHPTSFPSSVVLKRDDSDVKYLFEEFPEPKSIFLRVINEAYVAFQTHDVKPNVTFHQLATGKNNEKIWRATLSMTWPQRFQVEGLASRKTEAEKLAYLYACQKIKEHGFLNDNNLPVLPRQILNLDEKQIKIAKSTLGNIFNQIWAKFGNRDLIPVYNTYGVKGIFGNTNNWKCDLTLSYPEKRIFEGLGNRITDAEGIAATKALHWLYEKGVINKKKRPILYSAKDKKQLIENQNLPYPVQIPVELQCKIEEVLEHYEENSHVLNVCEDETDSFELNESFNILDIFTEKPYCKLSEDESAERSSKMLQQQLQFQQSNDLKIKKIRKERELFPIIKKKEEILRLLEQNQVLVISGETGCGKTTQVPQYILESFIEQMRGANCNIVVTQPRRISAISMAEYVAYERGEKVGETVGHQIRLNKIMPEGNGAVLFCSTGILLRKLCTNPNLEGVSHVIIDEVHERNIQIDFLLILLKNLLQTNKNIKLLLMSASFNTSIFSRYFNNCPVLHIPGHIYPVKEYFLDDISDIIQYNCDITSHTKIDLDLITKVIDYVDATQPSGAILCFLPGWQEIKTVSSKLYDMFPDKSKYIICPVHSRLSHGEQKRIFIRPPQNVRKIILATNIAETSITIDDVVYVIDSGFHKDTSFDSAKGTATLGTKWITKANVRQRRGRAGRVQPGVCYHLFPRKVLTVLNEYPSPEMHKVPLEKVILDCKLYCPDVKAEDFLSLALQPPSSNSINLGIQELQCLDILDTDENLTDLGKIVVNFSTHPRLSKALVLSTFFRCVDPVLTLSALQTVSQGPFTNSLKEKDGVRKMKQEYDDSKFSDHLTLYKIFRNWSEKNKDCINVEFNEKNMLDNDVLKFAKQLKGLFAEHLYEAGLIDSVDSFEDPEHKCNENSENPNVVLTALSSAFYPNVIKLTQGEISYGKLNPDVIIYSTVKGQKALTQRDSVVHKIYNLPSPWLTYFSAMKCEARKMLMAQDVSCFPGVSLLLFAGQEIDVQKPLEHQGSMKNDAVLVIDKSDKLKFVCTEDEAKLISKWRELLCKFFQLYLKQDRTTVIGENSEYNNALQTEILPLLKNILNSPQVPFEPGKKYFFHENELKQEDLI